MTERLFISYSHADDPLLDQLHKHLAQLRREGSVVDWYDREISAGGRIDDDIEREVQAADIFLACASPDWIASQYAYEKEFQTALEREAEGQAVVVPVIFKPCDWLSTPLKTFRALPKDGKPITEFINPDVAFLDVVTELRRGIKARSGPIETKAATNAQGTQAAPSKYRVKKEFDKLHKRDFIEESFSEIYRFFESSVAEIAPIPEIEARLSPVSDDQFSCTIINRGISRGFETLHVRKGGGWGAIEIAYGEKSIPGTSNGSFSVEADEYQLLLKPLLFRMMGNEDPLSPRQAGKRLWDDLLSRVGIDYA